MHDIIHTNSRENVRIHALDENGCEYPEVAKLRDLLAVEHRPDIEGHLWRLNQILDEMMSKEGARTDACDEGVILLKDMDRIIRADTRKDRKDNLDRIWPIRVGNQFGICMSWYGVDDYSKAHGDLFWHTRLRWMRYYSSYPQHLSVMAIYMTRAGATKPIASPPGLRHD
jgi:hypothetical protein